MNNTNQINLYESETKLILKYSEPLNGLTLFADLDYITEADLSDCILTDMTSMFSGCTSLTSIIFSGLDTTSVRNAGNLFYDCESLISIDFSKINLSNINDFTNIFNGCRSLEYINLINYDEYGISDYNSIKINDYIPSNLVICIDEKKAPDLYNSLTSKKCSIVYCGEDWKQNQLNYNVEQDICEKNNELKTGEEEDLIDGSEIDFSLEERKEKTDAIESFFNNNTYNNSIEKIIEAIKEGEFKKFMEETNKTELLKKLDDKIYQVSTISSQLNNDEIASIHLGDCEKELRTSNNINTKEDLIIFKISYIIPETKAQIIEYTIFTQDGIQLNLDKCKNILIQYEIPIDLNEKDLYKYDPNSEFYNEVCIQYSSESVTDMTKYDRKNEFNEKNMALCENNCEFIEYNKDKKKAICNCKIKNVFKSLDGIDKGKLLQKFTNYKKLLNLEVIKCFKLLFSKKGLIKNIGNYIILVIIFINIINLILFLTKGYKLFFKRIYGILHNNFEEILKTKHKNKNNQKLNKRTINQKKSFTTINKSEINQIKSFPPKKRRNKKSKTNKPQKIKSQISVLNDISISKNKFQNFDKEDNNKFNKNKEGMNDFEINSLSYEESQKYDDRNYWQYYLSLLRTKQIIIFTFYIKTDYNSRLIKISFFFSSFALFYSVKALFFNDGVMHVIYKNAGVYDFVFQLPQIIYSTIISIIIEGILSRISLSQINVVKIKNSTKERDNDEYKKEFNKFKIIIKLKFTIFFIINFLLLILFWYYLSCFCAVYKNTQGYLIKDVLIGFGISLIYPFLISLLPGIFRIKSLKDKNGNHKCMYYFSKILQSL